MGFTVRGGCHAPSTDAGAFVRCGGSARRFREPGKADLMMRNPYQSGTAPTCMADEPNEINEDGCLWQGSRESLEAWRAYKRDRALSLVRQGYSVLWSPDPANWMEVLLPERWYAKETEMRASAKFYSEPSRYGISGGKVSKLTIIERSTDPLAQVLGRPGEASRVWFNYDRGDDVNELGKSPRAQMLYEAVLEELN